MCPCLSVELENLTWNHLSHEWKFRQHSECRCLNDDRNINFKKILNFTSLLQITYQWNLNANHEWVHQADPFFLPLNHHRKTNSLQLSIFSKNPNLFLILSNHCSRHLQTLHDQFHCQEMLPNFLDCQSNLHPYEHQNSVLQLQILIVVSTNCYLNIPYLTHVFIFIFSSPVLWSLGNDIKGQIRRSLLHTQPTLCSRFGRERIFQTGSVTFNYLVLTIGDYV